MKSPAELMKLLKDATTADKIVAALAQMIHATTEGHDCFAMPVWSKLLEWWDRHEGTDLVVEVRECLFRVLGRGWHWAPQSERAGIGFSAEGKPGWLAVFGEVVDVWAVTLGWHQGALRAALLSVMEVHQIWLAKWESDRTLRHPLAPVVAAWQADQARPVPMANLHKRAGIMARSVAQVELNAERHYLARFSPAVHRGSDGKLLLGVSSEGRGPTLPANVWTMGLAPNNRNNWVAPELRCVGFHNPAHPDVRS